MTAARAGWKTTSMRVSRSMLAHGHHQVTDQAEGRGQGAGARQKMGTSGAAASHCGPKSRRRVSSAYSDTKP